MDSQKNKQTNKQKQKTKNKTKQNKTKQNKTKTTKTKQNKNHLLDHKGKGDMMSIPKIVDRSRYKPGNFKIYKRNRGHMLVIFRWC